MGVFELATAQNQSSAAQTSTYSPPQLEAKDAADLMAQLHSLRSIISASDFAKLLRANDFYLFQMLGPFGWKGSRVNDIDYVFEFNRVAADMAALSALPMGGQQASPSPNNSKGAPGSGNSATSYFVRSATSALGASVSSKPDAPSTAANPAQSLPTQSPTDNNDWRAINRELGLKKPRTKLTPIAAPPDGFRQQTAEEAFRHSPEEVREAFDKAAREQPGRQPLTNTGKPIREVSTASPKGPQFEGATAKTKRSLITGPRADIGESSAYKWALTNDEIGLERPQGTNVSGRGDFITAAADPDIAARIDGDGKLTIIVNDAKTQSSEHSEFPEPERGISEEWKQQVREAIDRAKAADPVLGEKLEDAWRAKRLVRRQVNVNLSPSGQGAIEPKYPGRRGAKAGNTGLKIFGALSELATGGQILSDLLHGKPVEAVKGTAIAAGTNWLFKRLPQAIPLAIMYGVIGGYDEATKDTANEVGDWVTDKTGNRVVGGIAASGTAVGVSAYKGVIRPVGQGIYAGATALKPTRASFPSLGEDQSVFKQLIESRDHGCQACHDAVRIDNWYKSSERGRMWQELNGPATKRGIPTDAALRFFLEGGAK